MGDAGTALGGFLFCGIGIVVVALIVVLFSAIRIVPEYQRLVVFR
jgi:regulator of protease activity HflC (stomatin/prohibitin superfamily)